MTGSQNRWPEDQREESSALKGESFEPELDSRMSPARSSAGSARSGPSTATNQKFNRRIVALMVDIFVAWVVATVVSCIPFITDFVSVPLIMTIVLLVRDSFYEGRGFGKNLMGLQVVDADSRQPCSLLQSCRRNIILYGPLLVLYIALVMLHWLQVLQISAVAEYGDLLIGVLHTLGFICILLALPYEAFQAYNRTDGRRFGDLMAGTTVTDAPMSFSKLLPRRQRRARR